MRQNNGEFELAFGIGFHTGSLIFGPVGTKERIDYTAIGPTVNVASRIQGLTKRFGCDILMSKDFQLQLPGNVETESAGRTEVRGLDAEIEVFKIGANDSFLRAQVLAMDAAPVSIHQSLLKHLTKDRQTKRKAA